jgi:hypothetical protein
MENDKLRPRLRLLSQIDIGVKGVLARPAHKVVRSGLNPLRICGRVNNRQRLVVHLEVFE